MVCSSLHEWLSPTMYCLAAPWFVPVEDTSTDMHACCLLMYLCLQSAYGDVNVRLELPPGVPTVRSNANAADGADGMQISTVCMCGGACSHQHSSRLPSQVGLGWGVGGMLALYACSQPATHATAECVQGTLEKPACAGHLTHAALA